MFNPQKPHVSITNISWPVLFKEIIPVRIRNHAKLVIQTVVIKFSSRWY